MVKAIKREIKVLQAEYVDSVQSILIIGECSEGKLRQQINRSCFSFGDRSEQDIKNEMDKTAELMIGKTINMVFDADLDGKIEDNVNLKY